MVGRTLANYRVVSQLGAGGMGVVYKAVDVRLDRSVALKVLPPGRTTDADRRARFLQEARSASALNDPHIVTIHDIFTTDDGTDVLVMELIQGRTLRDVISERPVPEGEALRLMLQVADGVAAAHAAGIVHRDLKPGNMMVTARGLVKILDFGLAKLIGPIDEQQTMIVPNTMEGTLLGTVDYMSPEQARGEPVDHRSDIFSLGAVLYELLTGVKPFQSGHSIGVLHEILYGQIVPPRERRPEVSADAEAITLRALERDVHRRYQSMEAMASDLRAAQRALSDGISSASRSGVSPIAPPAMTQLSEAVSGGAASLSAPSGAAPASMPPEPAATSASNAAAAVAIAGSVTPLSGSMRPPSLPRVTGMLLGALPVLLVVLFALPTTRTWMLEQLAMLRGDGLPDSTTAISVESPYDATQEALLLLRRFDRRGNIDRAIALLERTIASNPDYAPAYAAIAQVFARQADETREKTWTARALDAARQAVTIDAYLADAHLALGVALASSGDRHAADASLRKALELAPGDGRAWFSLGENSWRRDRRDEAADAYQKALTLMPDDWLSARALGNVAFFAGDYDKAIDFYRLAVKLAPDSGIAHNVLGGALHMKGDYSAAATELQKAISILPTPSSYSNLGTTLFVAGRFRESVGAFEKAVEMRPTDPLMWGNLADAYRWTAGMAEKSAEPYQRAIQLLEDKLARDPENVSDRSRLALYLAKFGDRQRSRAELAKITDLLARDVNTLYRGAVTYELVGQRSEALRLLERALSHGFSIRDVEADPELSNVRRDVGYQRVVVRVRSAR